MTVLLLVEQHQGRSRIQPQSPAHHADHHGDGGDPPDLVPAHADACAAARNLPPLPTPSNLHLTNESLGWLSGTFWAQISFVVIIVAFGHSLLAMSGFETLAQVYREIAYPKLKNLRITANIVCTYAVICTGVISVLAVMIIPDAIRSMYYDNLIGGLVDEPRRARRSLKLGFHVFVVIVGVLILAGAVNTSLIGVNGVMNRVAEDGVLLDWFRKPHKQVRDHLPHSEH